MYYAPCIHTQLKRQARKRRHLNSLEHRASVEALRRPKCLVGIKGFELKEKGQRVRKVVGM